MSILSRFRCTARKVFSTKQRHPLSCFQITTITIFPLLHLDFYSSHVIIIVGFSEFPTFHIFLKEVLKMSDVALAQTP